MDFGTRMCGPKGYSRRDDIQNVGSKLLSGSTESIDIGYEDGQRAASIARGDSLEV